MESTTVIHGTAFDTSCLALPAVCSVAAATTTSVTQLTNTSVADNFFPNTSITTSTCAAATTTCAMHTLFKSFHQTCASTVLLFTRSSVITASDFPFTQVPIFFHSAGTYGASATDAKA